MYVQTDHLGATQFGGPFVAAAPKRPSVVPAREGDRAQEDRRQQQDNQNSQQGRGSVFRTLLSETTLANVNAATAKQGKTAAPISAIDRTEFLRPEKRPINGPKSISGDETQGLFAQTSNAGIKTENENSQGGLTGRAPQAFVDAAARYAEQAVIGSNFLAGRGDTLELQV